MLCFLLCKKQRCKNAFDALQKCIFASNAFDAKMHFCVHFPKENVQQRCAKMHLMQKCIFATHHILRSKMFSITFSFVKCSASHFPKENVQHHIFQRKMFSKAKCSAYHLLRSIVVAQLCCFDFYYIKI